MAAQAALVAETIAGMKRAISGQQYSSDSDDAYLQPTNRGNKLKRKARFVQESHAGGFDGPSTYKRKIEHAGYHRSIIKRNPKRYDEDGEELDDDDDDSQADAEATLQNPYSEIKLEHLLAPLTSAADLPNHPSLSIPYTSTTLSDMVQQACEMVHRERKTLWSIKHLLTKLRGDDTWIPCGALDDPDVDEAIFGTKFLYNGSTIAGPRGGNKPGSEPTSGSGKASTQNGHAIDSEPQIMSQEEFEAIPTLEQSQIIIDDNTGPEMNLDTRDALDKPTAMGQGDVDVSKPQLVGNALGEEVLGEGTKSVSKPQKPSLTACNESIGATEDAGTAGNAHAAASEIGRPDLISALRKEDALPESAGPGRERATKESPNDEPMPDPSPEDFTTVSAANETLHNTNATTTKPEDLKDRTPTRSASLSSASHPAPHRMLTRAQAAASTSPNEATPTRSPSPPPFIHPLYLPPTSSHPIRDLGLPPTEAEETRRICMLWVQKQEEVVHGAEKLYEGLLKADRMRKTVWDWCKAEGHVGEMSDGEDWYDPEEWGLEGGLRKGNLEEEEEEVGGRGKKGRRRGGI